MKSKIKLLSIFVLTISLSFKSSLAQIDPNNIVGKWNFVEMLDQSDKHIDTLRDNNSFMIPNEGDYIFKNDSTYSAKFTEINIETGTWTYDHSNNNIILKLYLKKPYDEAILYIISLGFAKKDEKGDYYDLIPKKIIELTHDKMIILDSENRKLIYKKVK